MIYKLVKTWFLCSSIHKIVKFKPGDILIHVGSLTNDGNFFESHGGPEGWDVRGFTKDEIAVFHTELGLMFSPASVLYVEDRPAFLEAFDD